MASRSAAGPDPREPIDGATIPGASRHERTTPEFGRVANLSDGVFAIAMTLLVLTLDAPRVGTGGLAAALIEQLPQLLAFILAFALVANLWWQHHKLVALFDFMEPGIVGLNLVLLGAVALVPFPTSLVGNAPTDRAAVLAFIAVFSVLSLLFLLLVVRARQVGAWREGVSEQHVHWMLGQWGSGIAVLLIAALVAVWLPAVGLSVLALTMILGPVAARRGTVANRVARRVGT
jgi:uncharacterized membrane protein